MSVINYSFYRKSTEREFLGALSENILNLVPLFNVEENQKSDRSLRYSLRKQDHFLFCLCKNYNLCYTVL